MKTRIIIWMIMLVICSLNAQSGADILKKVDENLFSDSSIVVSRMVIEGRRGSREISTKTWSKGYDVSFTEYLSPPREKGTKMLKLGDKLWLYDKNSDRIIQISGHLLRQSVNGSDLSYEDFMDETSYLNGYNAVIEQEAVVYKDVSCWVLELEAKQKDATYRKRQLWVDKEKFMPLKEELYGSSGTLLKRIELSDIRKTADRWYPYKIFYKDVLNTKGKGTTLLIDSIDMKAEIPQRIFNKGNLRK